MKIAVGCGHNYGVTGANGFANEVIEDRLYGRDLMAKFRAKGNEVLDITPDRTLTALEDLSYRVNKANAWGADLMVSCHVNATAGAVGCEVEYNPNSVISKQYAEKVTNAIATLGFKNRGAKARTGLYELNNSNMPCILIEPFFCDTKSDVDLYKSVGYDKLAEVIANAIDSRGTAQIPLNGWHIDGSTWYYYQNGDMVKNGWAQDSKKKWFWLDADGHILKNGWIKWKEKWYYFGGDGSMFTNIWAYWKSKQYYLGSDGAMLTSTKTPDGYQVNEKGEWDNQPLIK